MRVVESRVRYEADGEPLLVRKYNCSLLLPPRYYGGLLHGVDSIFAVESETLASGATLYLSKAGERLIRGWLDEPWEEDHSKLELEGNDPYAGTLLNRFRSAGHVGYKARVDDVFENRVGLLVAGPWHCGKEVSQLAKHILGSVEFHDERSLGEEQLIDAITAYLNAPARTGADVFLYIARCSYLLRPAVVDGLRRLVNQMRAERHPQADYGAGRLQLLEKAREALDAGAWAEALAGLRGHEAVDAQSP